MHALFNKELLSLNMMRNIFRGKKLMLNSYEDWIDILSKPKYALIFSFWHWMNRQALGDFGII